MLTELQFVKGAASKKDFLPVLTHFNIVDGRITGYNGLLALSTPFPAEINALPNAKQFVAAVSSCREEPSISITPSGRLRLKAGSFVSYIQCLSSPFPEVFPSGEETTVTKGFLPVAKMVRPFISEDSSRPWSRGLLLHNGYAYATNNVVLVRAETGLPEELHVNIPCEAIDEVLRLGEEPASLQYSGDSLTINYSGGRWLYTLVYPKDWPKLDGLLPTSRIGKAIPEALLPAIETISKSIDISGLVFFTSGGVATDLEEEPTAAVSLGLPDDFSGAYNFKYLAAVLRIADEADFSSGQGPAHFSGPGIVGAILGAVV
jgi:DNA polymerase III sliding clamp (beta) subunit (PCNA family)